tara:strand:+ start:1236 stop:1787 length:552 start_codon:yes stop_codon:yes gene_type:complete
MSQSISRAVQALDNPFLFSNHEVRTALGDDGEAWFCAKDVFEALGITWKGARGSLMNCPEKWQVVCYLQTSHGTKETIFIAEPAVYQTSFRSNKPDAIKFTEWVCEEVLPAIRRQGYYGTLTAGQQIALRSQKIKLLEKLGTSDAFIYQAVLTSLRNICNQLGEPMPDTKWIGQDRKQLRLEV